MRGWQKVLVQGTSARFCFHSVVPWHRDTACCPSFCNFSEKMVKFANVMRQHLSQKKKINKELIWIDPPEIYFLGIENPPPHPSHWKISKKLSILDWCTNASLTLTTLPASLLQHLNVDYTHKQPRNEVYKCGENKSFSLLPVT